MKKAPTITSAPLALARGMHITLGAEEEMGSSVWFISGIRDFLTIPRIPMGQSIAACNPGKNGDGHVRDCVMRPDRRGRYRQPLTGPGWPDFCGASTPYHGASQVISPNGLAREMAERLERAAVFKLCKMAAKASLELLRRGGLNRTRAQIVVDGVTRLGNKFPSLDFFWPTSRLRHRAGQPTSPLRL